MINLNYYKNLLNTVSKDSAMFQKKINELNTIFEQGNLLFLNSRFKDFEIVQKKINELNAIFEQGNLKFLMTSNEEPSNTEKYDKIQEFEDKVKNKLNDIEDILTTNITSNEMEEIREKFIDKLLDQVTSIRKELNHSLTQQISQFDEQVNKVINGLNEYKFTEFLRQKDIDEDKIYQLINKHSGKTIMPFTIALLSEIDFLDYFFMNLNKYKNEGFKKLAMVFDVNARRIKGNVNILTKGSKEDISQYTSYQYVDYIREELKGL